MNLIPQIFRHSIIVMVALLSVVAAAEDNCNAWRTADADPGAGQYLIELRTCDLTYGLSAYIQIKNSSDKRLQLSYRLITKDDKSKDNDITLEPNNTTRAGNCQACAKRYAGLKSWEILSVKALKTDAPVNSATAAAVQSPPTAQPPAVVEKNVTKVEQVTPVEQPSLQEAPKLTEKAVPESKPSAPADADNRAERKLQPEGIKAADGTTIPYDQLPPEFRPRK